MKLLVIFLVLPACLQTSVTGLAPTTSAKVIHLESLPPPHENPQPQEMPELVPYPEAQAPNPMPAVAAAEDSDCSGLISLPPGRPRLGTWAMGEFVGNGARFTPMLFFNTKQDASDCVGSSGLKFARLTRKGWSQ